MLFILFALVLACGPALSAAAVDAPVCGMPCCLPGGSHAPSTGHGEIAPAAADDCRPFGSIPCDLSPMPLTAPAGAVSGTVSAPFSQDRFFAGRPLNPASSCRLARPAAFPTLFPPSVFPPLFLLQKALLV
jgi:hypothetical protein